MKSFSKYTKEESRVPDSICLHMYNHTHAQERTRHQIVGVHLNMYNPQNMQHDSPPPLRWGSHTLLDKQLHTQRTPYPLHTQSLRITNRVTFCYFFAIGQWTGSKPCGWSMHLKLQLVGIMIGWWLQLCYCCSYFLVLLSHNRQTWTKDLDFVVVCLDLMGTCTNSHHTFVRKMENVDKFYVNDRISRIGSRNQRFP